MKSALLGAIVTVSLLQVSPAWGQSKASQMAKSKGWFADLEVARGTARTFNKPLLVVLRCDP
jgi:hypothetical protein